MSMSIEELATPLKANMKWTVPGAWNPFKRPIEAIEIAGRKKGRLSNLIDFAKVTIVLGRRIQCEENIRYLPDILLNHRVKWEKLQHSLSQKKPLSRLMIKLFLSIYPPTRHFQHSLELLESDALYKLCHQFYIHLPQKEENVRQSMDWPAFKEPRTEQIFHVVWHQKITMLQDSSFSLVPENPDLLAKRERELFPLMEMTYLLSKHLLEKEIPLWHRKKDNTVSQDLGTHRGIRWAFKAHGDAYVFARSLPNGTYRPRQNHWRFEAYKGSFDKFEQPFEQKFYTNGTLYGYWRNRFNRLCGKIFEWKGITNYFLKTQIPFPAEDPCLGNMEFSHFQRETRERPEFLMNFPINLTMD